MKGANCMLTHNTWLSKRTRHGVQWQSNVELSHRKAYRYALLPILQWGPTSCPTCWAPFTIADPPSPSICVLPTAQRFALACWLERLISLLLADHQRLRDWWPNHSCLIH